MLSTRPKPGLSGPRKTGPGGPFLKKSKNTAWAAIFLVFFFFHGFSQPDRAQADSCRFPEFCISNPDAGYHLELSDGDGPSPLYAALETGYEGITNDLRPEGGIPAANADRPAAGLANADGAPMEIANAESPPSTGIENTTKPSFDPISHAQPPLRFRSTYNLSYTFLTNSGPKWSNSEQVYDFSSVHRARNLTLHSHFFYSMQKGLNTFGMSDTGVNYQDMAFGGKYHYSLDLTGGFDTNSQGRTEWNIFSQGRIDRNGGVKLSKDEVLNYGAGFRLGHSEFYSGMGRNDYNLDFSWQVTSTRLKKVILKAGMDSALDSSGVPLSFFASAQSNWKGPFTLAGQYTFTRFFQRGRPNGYTVSFYRMDAGYKLLPNLALKGWASYMKREDLNAGSSQRDITAEGIISFQPGPGDSLDLRASRDDNGQLLTYEVEAAYRRPLWEGAGVTLDLLRRWNRTWHDNEAGVTFGIALRKLKGVTLSMDYRFKDYGCAGGKGIPEHSFMTRITKTF